MPIRNVMFMAWKGMSGDERIWFASSTDGIIWQNQDFVRDGAGTSFGPALAFFNGKIYMAWKGMSGDERIWFASSTDGIIWQNQDFVRGGVGTSSRPALAAYKGRLYLVWKGMAGDERIWYSNSADGILWQNHELVGGVNGTNAGPALSVYDCDIIMVWKGVVGDSQIWYTISDGKRWSAQRLVPQATTNSIAALTVLNKKLYMAYEENTSIRHTTYKGRRWDAQTGIVQGIQTPPAAGPALAFFNGKLHMVWRGMGNDEKIWYSKSTDGVNWQPQRDIPGIASSIGPALIGIP
jgi:hypothetical protein